MLRHLFNMRREVVYLFSVCWQVDVLTDYRLLPLCAKRFVLADKDYVLDSNPVLANRMRTDKLLLSCLFFICKFVVICSLFSAHLP